MNLHVDALFRGLRDFAARLLQLWINSGDKMAVTLFVIAFTVLLLKLFTKKKEA